MAMQLGGITRREEAAGGGAAAADQLPHHQVVLEAGMLGLAVASAATTFAVSRPPPWLHRDDAYFAVALSGAFFVGVAQVAASVVWATSTGARSRAAGSKLLYAAAVALLGVAAGLELASLMLP